MIVSRIRQGLTYIFCKYNSKNDKVVKIILDKDEFKIFEKMSEYDKIHSFNLYKRIKRNKVLKKDLLYLKLALLHDCGKENYSLMRRVKRVLIGDKELETHSEKSYEKLRNINLDLAKKAREHHRENLNFKMEIFKKLDSK